MTPLETWMTLLIVLPVFASLAYMVCAPKEDEPEESSVPTPITPVQERRRVHGIVEIERARRMR